MSHDLRLITDPAVFGYPAWVCDCGHRSATWQEHEAHVIRSSHILYLLPPGVWKCSRCQAVWATESAADATPCEVTP